MSKWSKENEGMDLLKSVAREVLKNDSIKKRIWSDQIESWGYFDKKLPHDDFLIWCGSSVGDRFCLGQATDFHLVWTILSNEKSLDPNRQTRIIRLLDNQCKIFEFEIEESYLYRTAWSFQK